MGRSNQVSPETPSKSKAASSSTKIRMASRLPIILLLCLVPLLASALGEAEGSHEVDASLTELQASIVKREARECNGKGCKRKKKKNGAKKKEGAKKKGAARRKSPRKNQKGKNKEKKSPGKKSKSERRRQRQRKTKTGKNKNKKKKKKKKKKREQKKKKKKKKKS